MIRLYHRVLFFLAIVWRHGTGPNRDEPPMNWLRCWWVHSISIATAWDVAGVFHGRDDR